MRKRIQRQENLTRLINGGAEERLVILPDCVGVIGGVLGLEGLEVLGRVGVGVGGSLSHEKPLSLEGGPCHCLKPLL
jgi:hypothetical protein